MGRGQRAWGKGRGQRAWGKGQGQRARGLAKGQSAGPEGQGRRAAEDRLVIDAFEKPPIVRSVLIDAAHHAAGERDIPFVATPRAIPLPSALCPIPRPSARGPSLGPIPRPSARGPSLGPIPRPSALGPEVLTRPPPAGRPPRPGCLDDRAGRHATTRGREMRGTAVLDAHADRRWNALPPQHRSGRRRC